MYLDTLQTFVLDLDFTNVFNASFELCLRLLKLGERVGEVSKFLFISALTQCVACYMQVMAPHLIDA